MNPTTPLFSDGSSPQQLYVKIFPDEELIDLLKLSNDERGLYVSLRWFSLKNGGLPENLEEMWEEVRYFAGISRYKFFKLVPKVLAKKFQNICGRFFAQGDEERIEESRDRIVKFRESGRLGASRRWNRSNQEASGIAPVPMATPSAPPMAASYLASQLVKEVPAAAAETTGVMAAAGAGSLFLPEDSPGIATLSEPLTDTEHQNFNTHCKNNNIPLPDRATVQKLKAKFSKVFPTLPVFADQRSAGLWLKLDSDRVVQEAERQKQESANPRKPVTKEKPQYHDPYRRASVND